MLKISKFSINNNNNNNNNLAEELLQQRYEIKKEIFGKENSETISANIDLAEYYNSNNNNNENFNKAEEIYKDCLIITTTTKGIII